MSKMSPYSLFLMASLMGSSLMLLVTECPSDVVRLGQIKSVKITECFDEKANICTIKRNAEPRILIDFVYLSRIVSRRVNATVNAILPDVIVAPPVFFDACSNGVKCPCVQNQFYQFNAPMPVRTQHIPPYEVAFSFKITDNLGPEILCFFVSVTVGDKKPV